MMSVFLKTVVSRAKSLCIKSSSRKRTVLRSRSEEDPTLNPALSKYFAVLTFPASGLLS